MRQALICYNTSGLAYARKICALRCGDHLQGALVGLGSFTKYYCRKKGNESSMVMRVFSPDTLHGQLR